MRNLCWLWMAFCSSVIAADVVLIESYRAEFEWDKSYLLGINEELNPNIKVARFEMDTKRIPRSEFDEVASKAWAFYLQHQPKVVIIGDDNALLLMYPKLFNQPVSIAFLGINSNPRRLLMQYPGQAKVTGILERPLFIKNLSEISMLLNNKQLKVLILLDASVTSLIASEYILEQYELVRNGLGIEIEVHNVAQFDEWQNQVNRAAENGFDAMILGPYQAIVDDKQQNVDAGEVMAWTNQHSQVPLFGFWDYAIGQGKAVGGVVLTGESQGRAVAKLVNRIFNGEDADLIPIQIGTQGIAMFSRSEAQRWHISPPNSWRALD